MALLEVKDLEVYYGVICALKGISFEVNEGEIVTLIGANGAGKTTTRQSVVGLIPKRAGTVTFDGHDINKTPCHKIVHLGMTQVPEGRRIFQELTVYENLVMGAYTQTDKNKKEMSVMLISFILPSLKFRKLKALVILKRKVYRPRAREYQEVITSYVTDVSRITRKAKL